MAQVGETTDSGLVGAATQTQPQIISPLAPTSPRALRQCSTGKPCHVALRLCEAMVARRMTIAALAAALGVSRPAMGKLRLACGESPHLSALALHLDISLAWLTRGIGTMDARDTAASPAPAPPSPSPPPVPNA